MTKDDRVRVAIVDDDASVSTALVRLCDVAGFDATAYASGQDFLAALASGAQVDCLVLDAHMPEMTGPELQRHLLAQRFEIPTIFLTADQTSPVLEKAIETGRVMSLQKPVETDTLLGAIESITGSIPPKFE